MSLGQHKYDSGVLYIIAGSEGLTGAAIMAAQSAWAEEIGAVILVCPRALLPIYEHTLPSIIKKPVGNREDYFLKEEHTSEVLAITQEKNGTVLLGPGLGRKETTVKFVQSFIEQNPADTVIDADGLWALSQISTLKKHPQSNWILTPHPGELTKLTQEDITDDTQRLIAVKKIAHKYNATILSKGMPAIVGTPAGKCYLTNYDTRYFARAGSGDVLAGKVSAYYTHGYPPSYCCALGLLQGKQKLDNLLEEYQRIPEPKDFI